MAILKVDNKKQVPYRPKLCSKMGDIFRPLSLYLLILLDAVYVYVIMPKTIPSRICRDVQQVVSWNKLESTAFEQDFRHQGNQLEKGISLPFILIL